MPQNPVPQVQQPKITFSDTTEVKCSKCGGKFFQDSVLFRRVSRLLTGRERDEFLPVQAPICVQCHEPLKELLSPEVAGAL
jgi:hypothetical protein